jgi:phosphoglycolate phosphatase
MHVLLFDIDGTLLASGGAGQAAMEAALRKEFLPTLPPVDIPTAGRTDRAICMDLFQKFNLAPSAETWTRFCTAYFDELPRHLRQRTGLVLPGVKDLLGRLSEREDVLIGLLTGNFREGARLKLVHYELHHHFQCGGYGDHHLDRDDVAREAWQAVREIAPHAELDRTWVIGDTPSDIRCARAIGAKVLAVATGMFGVDELAPHGPDALRADVSDHEDVLRVMGLG